MEYVRDKLPVRVLTRRCLKSSRAYMLGAIEYLICNGVSAGKWTLFFGPHCCADSLDCNSIQDAQYKIQHVAPNGDIWGDYEWHHYIIQRVV